MVRTIDLGIIRNIQEQATMTKDFKVQLGLKYTILNLTEGYSLELFWPESTILISKSAKICD